AHQPAPPGAEINSQREQEMIRTALVVAMLAFGATALVAQSDPIAARKSLMKANGDQSKLATDMLEAKQPFNLDAAKKVFATFAEAGEKAPALSYQRMRLEDVRDLFAYLKTLPAVQGKARDHDLPLYLKFRPMLGGWKFLFLDGEQFKPDTSKPAPWNCGAYLVNCPGHCAESHSPRNLLGGIVESQRFAGGPDPEGGD